jgi:LysM repeat protein
MQQPIKRLVIVILTLFLLSSHHTGTASAYPVITSEKVYAGVYSQNTHALIHPQNIKENEFGEELEASVGTPVAQNTSVPLAMVVTSTADADGVIIHIVQYGETLFTIAEAYGVPIDQILTNSGLSLTATDLREGQTLVIQTAKEPTITPSPTATIDPGTPTPTQVRPTLTPFPTRTPAPTSTPTKPPSLICRTLGNTKYFGIGLILISGLGLILVIYLGFLKKS